MFHVFPAWGVGGARTGTMRTSHCELKSIARRRRAVAGSAMAVNIENRVYATVEACPSCDWHVSKAIYIEVLDIYRIRRGPVAPRFKGQTYAEINMNRNDVIRYTAHAICTFCCSGMCATLRWL